MLKLKMWPLPGEEGLTQIILCTVKYFCTGMGYVSLCLRNFQAISVWELLG